MRIHFICRGNAHRSVMAEAYLRSLNLPGIDVLSSGTVAADNLNINQKPFADTRTLLTRHGIGKYSKVQPEQLTLDRISPSDVTIFLNQRAADEAEGILGQLPVASIVWDVDDTGEGARILAESDPSDKYDEELFEQITHLVDELIKKSPHS